MRSWSRTGEPDAVVLFDYHLVELGLQVGPHCTDGVLFVEGRDGSFQAAALADQLEWSGWDRGALAGFPA
jgi:hypothetical protein